MAFYQAAIIGNSVAGESFRMGFSIDTGLTGEASAAVVAGHVATSFTSRFTFTIGGATFAEKFSAGVSFTKVMVYERPKDPTGPSTEIAETGLTGLNGNSGAITLPPEIAVCVSLLTGAPGRSNRGRMYLPATHVSTVVAPGVLVGSTQTFFASWAASLFSTINGAIDGGDVVVWSRKNQATRNVTQVLVGNQFDVQRRRQNASPESYASAAVTP